MKIQTKGEIASAETMGIFDADEIAVTGLEDAMDIYAKQTAIEFFKWHRNNYSSQPNEEEIKERYEVFINEINK